MILDWKKGLIGIVCSMSLFASVARGQAPAYSAPVPGAGHVTKSADRPQGIVGPVPLGIKSAHKIFLSNGGSDAGLFPHPFTGTQDRAYGYMYSQLAASKQFELTSMPADADLVLELELSAPAGSLGGDKRHGTEDALPSFKLKIYDRPTHYVLWSITQTIDQANLQKTHDKNFDEALDLLLTQFALLTKPTN